MVRDRSSHRANIMVRAIAVTVARDLGTDSSTQTGELRRIMDANLVYRQSAKKEIQLLIHRTTARKV